MIRLFLLPPACVLAAWLFANGAVGDGAELSAELRGFLRQVGLPEAELSKAEAGRVVAKGLPTKEQREVAVAGLAYVQAPLDDFVTAFRDIASFKRSENVLEIAQFSDPPRMEDTSGLTLEPDDIDALRTCKVGDCDLRLPARVIRQLGEEVSWSARDRDERATAVARQLLVEYVRAYLAGGDASLSEYDDTTRPLRLVDEFASIMQASPYLAAHAPGFAVHLERFPHDRLPGADDFVYWSKERFGLKPVLSVTHVTIYRREHAGLPEVLISSKQIYASRYFDASLGLTVAAATSADASKPGFFLLYVNRSRANALKGGFSGLKRSVVGRRARQGMDQNLLRVRARLEATWRQKAGIKVGG
jgi:hypothetical protein